MDERICPICGVSYRAIPAVSRADNKTLICPDCGTREALEAIGIKGVEIEHILETVHKYSKEDKS